MKKLLLPVLLLVNTFCAHAQADQLIGISKQFNENDTTRSFVLVNGDRDLMKERLISAWGKPKTNTTGIIEWEKVYIEALHKEVNIIFLDGITTHNIKERSSYWEMFKSDADKNKKMRRMVKGQDRSTGLMFTNPVTGQNDINTSALEKLLQEYLYGIIKPG